MKSLSLICLLLFCGIVPVAQAADYAIAPLIAEHEIEPRDIFEEEIRISNTTDRPLRLFPTVNAITLGESGDIQTFVPASMSDKTSSVTSWIAVSRGRLEIAPGETVKVPVTVSVNPNAVPGEYHAFIGFAEGSKRDEAEAAVLAGTAPGTIFRLSLVEKRTEYLRLNRFAIARYITNDADAVVQYELENVGGMPIAPAGEIIFYDGNGVEVTAVALNDEKVTLEAGVKQMFTVAIPDLGGIGRHKAFLNIEYGTTQRANLYDTVYFNMVPLKLILIIFFVVLTLSIILAILYHRSRHVYHDADDEVAVYVRSGVSGTEKDHDINLKS